MHINRIAIFTGALSSYSVRKGIRKLAHEFPAMQFLIVDESRPCQLDQVVKNQWRNLKRNGWRWIPYQMGELTALVRSRFYREPPSFGWRPGVSYLSEVILMLPNVSHLGSQGVHAQRFVERIRMFCDWKSATNLARWLLERRWRGFKE